MINQKRRKTQITLQKYEGEASLIISRDRIKGKLSIKSLNFRENQLAFFLFLQQIQLS